MQKVIYETGATSHAVNDLILFTDNTPELVTLRDKIYKSYLPEYLSTLDKDNVAGMLKHAFINRLLYNAMNKYLDVFTDHESHKHIEEMTVEEQDEFAQLYVDDFEEWKKEKKRNP